MATSRCAPSRKSDSEKVDLELPVPMLPRPQVKWECCQLIHDWDSESGLRQIDTFQVGMARIADVNAYMSDLGSRVISHLRLSFFSAGGTVDSSKIPFVSAEHANQRFLCAVT